MSGEQRAWVGEASLIERKQVLDDAWLLMLLAVALVVGTPWFLRNLPIDIAPAIWAVFAYGVIYLAVSRTVDGLRGRSAVINALTAMQAASVAFLAFLWHIVGSIQNPMFLMVFAIPIAASGCVLNAARAFALATLAIAAVATVAVANAPELRWYLTQLGVPAELFPGGLVLSPARPFPGLDLPASWLFLLLLTFTGLTLSLVLVTHSVALMVRRLHARLAAATRAAGDAGTLASELLHAMPFPSVLVYADTFNVVEASASFLQRMGLLPESLQERNLFGLVDFAYPEVIEEAIARGGDVAFAIYRAGGTASAARIHASRVEHAGVRFAFVVIEDIAEHFTLQAAIGAVAASVVVIGEDDRVRYFNPAAAVSLPGLQIGMHASTSLGQADSDGWWRLGERGQRQRQVVLSGKPFDARCVAANAPGKQDRLTVVELTRAAA